MQAALRVLRAEGLIVSRRGSGTFVAEHPLPAAAAHQNAPKIRIHRYEHILAIKWPEFDRWLMVWPNEYAGEREPAATTEWRPLLFGEADFEDRHEWIDPAAEHHADVTPRTGRVRRELAQTVSAVTQILNGLDAHPWQR
ncbi:hypothetical protein [Nonomuraea sp. NPDC050540]|uniref:hypothetical protein n=1 Tax=Nonomuraea sp. NPDC050540 TaxID=3364367 RepID=UPI003787E6B2